MNGRTPIPDGNPCGAFMRDGNFVLVCEKGTLTLKNGGLEILHHEDTFENDKIVLDRSEVEDLFRWLESNRNL